MKATTLHVPPELSATVRQEIEDEVTAALVRIRTTPDEFVVNPTRWFRGQGRKATPTVMNSAKYITGGVERELRNLGWTPEKTIIDQRIDAYKEFKGEGNGVWLPKSEILRLTDEFWDSHDDPSDHFGKLVSCYSTRRVFDRTVVAEYNEAEEPSIIRVGFEFETGNIASSFRALSKLDTLFKTDKIDVGVFVTSLDKRTATQIWPPSNRNGSFEELKNRSYSTNVSLPLLEIGIAPDRIDPKSPYLASDGTTYQPTETDTSRTVDGVVYSVHEDNRGNQILLPV